MIESRIFARYVTCFIYDNCRCTYFSCGYEIWSHSVREFRASDIKTLSTAFRYKRHKKQWGERDAWQCPSQYTRYTNCVRTINKRRSQSAVPEADLRETTFTENCCCIKSLRIQRSKWRVMLKTLCNSKCNNVLRILNLYSLLFL
jgi:hypothetical protein